MQFSPRNQVVMLGHSCPADAADYLYEVCDAEFASDKDVHEAFARLDRGTTAFDKFLAQRVLSVASREGHGDDVSYFAALCIARKIADAWCDNASTSW